MNPRISRMSAVSLKGRADYPRPCLVNNFRRLLVGPVPHDFALGPEPVERACAGVAREKWHVASDVPYTRTRGNLGRFIPRHALIRRAIIDAPIQFWPRKVAKAHKKQTSFFVRFR
jgi:hypothetical protein